MKKTKIADIEFDNPFFLAPMAGYTDSVYRTICDGMGAGFAYAEMVSAKGLCYESEKTKTLLEIDESEGPVGFQIFGSDADIMARATEMLEPMKNVLVDINMGCPVPKIVKNGEGSALLRSPETIYRIVKAVTGATAKPVTIKMRTGIQGASENAAIEAAQAAEAGGAAALCVHGRTREQYYSGEADREIIAEIKRSVAIPVIGNGDIRSYEDAVSMMSETGCDMVMIGRGALGNPWLFKALSEQSRGAAAPEPPTLEERKRIVVLHYERLAEKKGEAVAVREMRKFVPQYFKGVRGSAALRGTINNITSGAEFRKVIEEFV